MVLMVMMVLKGARIGEDGAAATIGNPTITTGLAGTEASVTNSGTSSAAVFDFVIPRGDQVLRVLMVLTISR